MSRSSVFGLQAVPERTDARADVASWYTPGWSDALGDRLLMFDNTMSADLELLRFAPALGETPGFESALRAKVEALRGLSHDGLTTARSVRRLGEGEGLALVSTHAVGRRLSEMLGEARGAGFAAEAIRQLTPILVALHAHKPGLSHGTLTAGRVMVTAGGRLVVTEAAVGGALEALRLPADRLRREFGLAVRGNDDPAALDQGQDLVQLGFLAISLLAGKALPPDTPNERLATILEHHSAMPWGPGYAHLRAWLERALHLSAPFSSAAEAAAAVRSWPEGELAPGERPANVVVHPAADHRLSPPPTPASPPADDRTKAADELPVERETVPFPVSRPVFVAEPPVEPPATELPTTPPPARRLTLSLGVIALAEAVAIAVLASMLLRSPSENASDAAAPAEPAMTATETAEAAPPPAAAKTGRVEVTTEPAGARVSVDGSPRGTTPLSLTLDAGRHTIVLSAGQTTTRRTVTVSPGATSTLMASLRSADSAGGYVSFETPIELQVSEGGTLLGTTRASRLMLPAGAHQLELTNAALGIRDTLSVDIQAGRTATARVAIPKGSLSLNALPWANVWLDNQPLGTTPVANISVTVGSHEVLWRHPQYGERRETVVVTARSPVRVVTDLTQ